MQYGLFNSEIFRRKPKKYYENIEKHKEKYTRYTVPNTFIERRSISESELIRFSEELKEKKKISRSKRFLTFGLVAVFLSVLIIWLLFHPQANKPKLLVENQIEKKKSDTIIVISMINQKSGTYLKTISYSKSKFSILKYKHGKLHGKSNVYIVSKDENPDTLLIHTTVFQNNNILEYYSYYKDGNIMSVVEFSENQIPILKTNYFETGQIESEGEVFSDDKFVIKRIGIWIHYDKSGKITWHEEIKDDNMDFEILEFY